MCKQCVNVLFTTFAYIDTFKGEMCGSKVKSKKMRDKIARWGPKVKLFLINSIVIIGKWEFES